MIRRVFLLFLLAFTSVIVASSQRADGQQATPNVIIGTDAAETLSGTPADDSIYARGGNDRLDGGAGNDDLDGGAGADDIRGGAGEDAVSYAASAVGVKVTADNRAGDGAAGESDNVHADVEGLYGGPGGDELIGGNARNTVDGGEGDDTLKGGAGADGLYGGAGRDVIDARDRGVDTVDCGADRDEALLDLRDDAVDCEKTNVATFDIDRFASRPEDVPASEVCRGTVIMKLVLKGKVLVQGTAKVRGNCGYGREFRILRSRIGSAKTLTLVVRKTDSAAAFSYPIKVPQSG